MLREILRILEDNSFFNATKKKSQQVFHTVKCPVRLTHSKDLTGLWNPLKRASLYVAVRILLG